MKKSMRLFGWNIFLLMAAGLFITSCSQENSENPERENKQCFSLSVSPEQWSGEGLTRATYSGFSESSGNKIFQTTFQSGDAIGIFACDKTGKVTIANRKYTYNGSTWNAEEPIEYITGLGSYTFFTYYPWVASLSGAPAVDDTPDITSADTFFGAAVTAWTPATDQSTLAAFTGSDLMIAKGTNNTPYFHEVTVSFTLAHKMGLLITKGTLSYYNINDPSDTWTVDQTFSPNVPYAISDKYYFFAKPNTATTLGSKTVTVGSGQLEQLYFTDGEPSTH